MNLPSQIKYIVGNEACERFSFYGMTSLLMAYMTYELNFTEGEATGIQHAFNACVYLMPILGGWLADKFLGRYNCILYISLFYCLGHGVLATADLTTSLEIKRYILACGLGIIAMGAGGIKPCVSAFAGDQMAGQTPGNMTRMYSAFYWSINLGSFFAFLIIPAVSDNFGYSWAFAVPGIIMAIATAFFFMGRKYYLHITPDQPQFLPSLITKMAKGKDAAIAKFGAKVVEESSQSLRNIAKGIITILLLACLGYLSYKGSSALAGLLEASDTLTHIAGLLGCVLALAIAGLAFLRFAAKQGMQGFVGTAGCMLFDKIKLQSYSEAERVGARNLLRVLAVFAMIIPFWSLFDQTSTTWQIQRRDMVPITFDLDWLSEGFSYTLGAKEFTAMNPLLVMLLIPTLTIFVYPYLKKWVQPLRRMSIGIILVSISYGIVAYLQSIINGGAQISILWQCIPYVVITLGEIFVSTTGLEYAYTAAGKKLKSMVTSFWYLSSTLGNIFVVIIASLFADPAGVHSFIFYGVLMLVVGILFLIVTTRKKFQAEAYLD